jgi:hypothetical protein
VNLKFDRNLPSCPAHLFKLVVCSVEADFEAVSLAQPAAFVGFLEAVVRLTIMASKRGSCGGSGRSMGQRVQA